jgi:hypothetical protein
LACSRAWERYFANHPESKSEHAKKCAAVLLVGISLGHKELKPKWGELLTIYGEIAKEMGLPETSPPSIMKVLPGKYPRGEDIPLVPIQPVG